MFLLLIPGSKALCAEEPSSEAQRITSTMNKVIDAYGGKDIIEGIHSLHAKGKIEAFMLHDHGTYEFYFNRGKKLRVETKYEHSSEVRILNDERGYRSTDTLPFEEVYGPRFLSMVYQYKHLNILHDLITGAYQIRSVGLSYSSGDNIEVFRLNDKEGTVMDIFIDRQTFFIVKVAAYRKIFSEPYYRRFLFCAFGYPIPLNGIMAGSFHNQMLPVSNVLKDRLQPITFPLN
jgi:hypothetical protein